MKIFSLTPNYDEKFPHLNNAPIKEAVIDLQVLSAASWNASTVREQLKTHLSNYPKIEENHEIKHTLTNLQPTVEDLGCVGFRATSRDGFYVAQFTRRGFTLSRIRQYDHWDSFREEAHMLWDLYCEWVQPSKIKRIGVRFINRMLADYKSKGFLAAFTDPPKVKQIIGWELDNFLHRDTLRVPNTGYRVNIIKTVVSSPTKPNEVAAILDSDVFYPCDLQCGWDNVAEHLKAMHWIKNKVFFASITKKKVKECK